MKFNNNGFLLSISIVTIMSLSLVITFKKVRYNYIYIVLLYNSFIIFVAICGIIISHFIILFKPEVSTNQYYIAKCLLAKIMQIVITIIVLIRKVNLSISLDFKNWSFVIVYYFFLLALLIISTYSLVSGYISQNLMLIINFITFIATILFGHIIHKLDELNKRKVALARLEELTKFNIQKLSMMNRVKEEINSTDHRMFYILIQMEQLLQLKKYNELKSLLSQYRDMITKYKIIIDTKNVVFDCLYSLKINDFILKGKDITNIIFISCNNRYNDIRFINFITTLLDFFACCKTIIISMSEIGNQLIIKITYRNGTISEGKLLAFISKTVACRSQ